MINSKRLKSLLINTLILVVITAILVVVFGEVNGRTLRSYVQESFDLKDRIEYLEDQWKSTSVDLQGARGTVSRYEQRYRKLVILKDDALEEIKELKSKLGETTEIWTQDN